MEKIRRMRNRREYGSMLALALVIVLVLALIGAGLIKLGLNARLQSIKDVKQISARTAADAGIEHAMRYMINQWNTATSKSIWLAAWNDATVWPDTGIPPVGAQSGYELPTAISLGSNTYGNAKFTYTIYKGKREKGYQIVSTGTAGGLTRTVHAAAVLKSSYVGVGAREDIYLAPNVNLDTVPANETMVIQTNGTDDGIIDIKSGVTVPGDVVCGPGGDPADAIINKGTIEGQQLAAQEEIEFPPLFVPEKFSSMPYGGANMTIVEPNAYITGDIKLNGLAIGSGTLKNVKTIYIQGDVDIFVDGATTLESPGSKVIVADNSKLDLYLGGDFSTSPNCQVIYGGEVITEAGIIEAASSISIKGTVAADGTPLCDEIHFHPDGDFYGTIYAPDASIEMWPNGDFYGAVVGGYDVLIKPGGSYIYIPDLVNTQDIEILYMGIKYGSWWEQAN